MDKLMIWVVPDLNLERERVSMNEGYQPTHERLEQLERQVKELQETVQFLDSAIGVRDRRIKELSDKIDDHSGGITHVPPPAKEERYGASGRPSDH